jgi:hypothetical protein
VIEKFMRGAALPVTNRRWAALLSALALGFGLFVGVALGPGSEGTLATDASQIIELPALLGGEEEEAEANETPVSSGSGDDGGGSAGEIASEAPPVPFTPAAPETPSDKSDAVPESAPASSHPPPKKPPPPPGPTLTGTVVHVNPLAGSYTLAEAGGELSPVHAAKLPAPGTRLSVVVRTLANGTSAEAGSRKRLGQQGGATLKGIVTAVDPTPAALGYTISKRGVSILVRVPPGPAGASPQLPLLGAFVTVGVVMEEPAGVEPAPVLGEPAPVASEAVTPPPAEAPAAGTMSVPPPTCSTDASPPVPAAVGPQAVLWQRSLSSEGAPFTYGDFAGIVRAVCLDSGQLLLSADDIGEGGRDLTFAVPDGVEMSGLQVGQSVIATATIGEDGTLGLMGLASDERTRGADDKAALQGDLAGS